MEKCTKKHANISQPPAKILVAMTHLQSRYQRQTFRQCKRAARQNPSELSPENIEQIIGMI
jgi:hypothetical protein